VKRKPPLHASSRELETVQATRDDIMIEEFPEGAYGAATHPEHLGKSSPWEPGQHVVSRFQDENPESSNRKVPGWAEDPDSGPVPPGPVNGND
jgi:hypothetical protein